MFEVTFQICDTLSTMLARIVTDSVYLQNAFRFFGWVRVAEVWCGVCTRLSPPEVGKVKELLNALAPVRIVWLAGLRIYSLRQLDECGFLSVDLGGFGLFY